MRNLIRKIRPIARYPEIAFEDRDRFTRGVLDDDDAVATLAKCLRPGGITRCDENRVNANLKMNSERGGFEAAVSAAGANDEGRRIARRKGLRSHENPVIGGAVRRQTEYGGAPRR